MNIRHTLRSAAGLVSTIGLIGAITLGGAIMTAGPASAADSMVKLGPSDCLYGVGRYETHLGTPRKWLYPGTIPSGKSLAQVLVDGNIDIVNNTNCSHPTVQFLLQTKVCGTFGCHWQTKDNTNAVLLPRNGRITTQLSMNCRKGKNSYRLQAKVTHVELTYEDDNSTGVTKYYPTLVTITNTHEGSEEKIDCSGPGYSQAG